MLIQFYRGNEYVGFDKQAFSADELAGTIANLSNGVSITVWFA